MNIIADIDMQDPRWGNSIKDLDAHVHKIINHSLAYVPFFKGQSVDNVEISLVFADDAVIQDLNKGYRDKDRPTNVLSFPQIDWDEPDMPFPMVHLGDEIFAFETIELESEEQEKSFVDHTTHLIVHGLLHLCGYDHIKKDEAEIMEALEIEILEGLGINNPYQN